MSHIPTRNGQGAVNRFAKCIATIDANYPKVVVLSNEEHYTSITDFRAFLRGAIRGVAQYGIKHSEINTDSVKKWFDKYTTRIWDGKILVGGRQEVKAFSGLQDKTVGLAVDAEVNLTNNTITDGSEEILRAILILHDAGFIEDVKFELHLKDTIINLVSELNLDTDTHATNTHLHIF